MRKLILFAFLLSCLVFTKNSFAKTRQRAYEYKGGYIPAATYVFTNTESVTKLKRPAAYRKTEKYSVAGALSKLAGLIRINKKITAVKFKPKKFIIYGFHFNSYKINKTLKLKLAHIKNLINKKSFKVESITGYTDHFGTKSYNNKLAFKRAKSVENYLGLKNIKLLGYGKCCYISKINLKDRRVIIYGLEKF
ncbi:MAG: OmpA family protein [bacterium]